MRVYRETRAVTRTPELVARAIKERCGPPTGGSWQWSYCRLGLYAHVVRLDLGSGQVHVTVRVPEWLRALSLATLPAVVVLLAVGAPPDAFLLVLWAAALAVLVPPPSHTSGRASPPPPRPSTVRRWSTAASRPTSCRPSLRSSSHCGRCFSGRP